MGSGMNTEQAKELASKKNYKWAVGNIRSGKGIAYRKATMILLRELAEIADRLVLCKDCISIDKSQFVTTLDGYVECPVCERDGVLLWEQRISAQKEKGEARNDRVPRYGHQT